MSTLSFSIGFLSHLPPLQRFGWVRKGWLIHTWWPSCFRAPPWPPLRNLCLVFNNSIHCSFLQASPQIEAWLPLQSHRWEPQQMGEVCVGTNLLSFQHECWSCKFTVQDERDALLKDRFKFSFKAWLRHTLQSIKSNWVLFRQCGNRNSFDLTVKLIALTRMSAKSWIMFNNNVSSFFFQVHLLPVYTADYEF